MGGYYINFYFHNIEYDDGFYGGEFSASDYRVYCKFLYDRETKEFIDKLFIALWMAVIVLHYKELFSLWTSFYLKKNPEGFFVFLDAL